MKKLIIGLFFAAMCFAQGNEQVTSNGFVYRAYAHTETPVICLFRAGLCNVTDTRLGLRVELNDTEAREADAYEVTLRFRDAAGKVFVRTQVVPSQKHYPAALFFHVDEATPLSAAIRIVNYQSIPEAP